MNAIQAEQKAITDSHDLLRNFSEIFQKFRPSTDSDFSNKGKLEKGAGFVSSAHERIIKPMNTAGAISCVSRPTLHQIL
ncbi:hypothetical protein [Phaffia rhodozyma]|uniref:Uncharacterized protein n=1 Tax=Phaffia rhodozyma TaxID=264483 RepID=A0A0F7SVS2_PHARH|nr:hypothetical protein [Phaffia rhodozyma]